MRFDWRLILAVGAVSAVTMPLTAIWFLLAGFLTFTAAALVASSEASRWLPNQQSFGCGSDD